MSNGLVQNSAKCLSCGVEIISKHTHDFQECSCGNVFVDGGLEYLRHGYRNKDQYTNTSKFEELG